METLHKMHVTFSNLRDSQKKETLRSSMKFPDTKIIWSDIKNAREMGVVIEYQSAEDLVRVLGELKRNQIFRQFGSADILRDIIEFCRSDFLDFESIDAFFIQRTKCPLLCLSNSQEDRQYRGISSFLELNDWRSIVSRRYETSQPGIISPEVITLVSVVIMSVALIISINRKRA